MTIKAMTLKDAQAMFDAYDKVKELTYRPVAEPTPAPPPAPHPGDAFHRHMLACQQCGEHRFALCEQGQVLYATMMRDWPGAEIGQDKFQRATAAQSAVESWYAARFYR